MPTDAPTRTAPLVVATDGSEESVVAARWATHLANALGAPIEVLDVVHQPNAEMPPGDVARLEHDARDALDRRLRASGITPTGERAVVGDVATVLTESSRHASLLVLGSAERAGWGRHGHFSLVHSLAHHVDCPIAVVPAGTWTEREPVVLVGIDGTSASRRTLEWARAFADRASMRVVAAFVVDAIYTTFASGGWYGDDEQGARSESHDESVELIERFGADPAVTLQALAEERRASLLVVGAKEHHSLGGTLLGAIPDELLHHPTCPIAVVPHTMVGAPE